MVIGKADTLPVSTPTPVVSVSPVTLTVPGRVVDLELRVSAPVTGSDLPILLLSQAGFLPAIERRSAFADLILPSLLDAVIKEQRNRSSTILPKNKV